MLNKQEISVLIAEIRNELARLEKLTEKLAGQPDRLDDEITESAALRLHNFLLNLYGHPS